MASGTRPPDAPGPRTADLLALAALVEPAGEEALPEELAGLPALRWVVARLAPALVARVGLGSGALPEALAGAVARLDPPGRVLAAPWEGEAAGAGAPRLDLADGGTLRWLDDAAGLPEAVGEGALSLLSLARPEVGLLRALRPALAEDGVVAIDAPDPAAARRAAAAIGDAFGSAIPSGWLGGVAIALPGASPPDALAAVLARGAREAALGALLERLGRGMAAEAAMGRRGGEAAEPLPALDEAQDRALAALREVDALREALSEARRGREEDARAIARAMGARERALREAQGRIEALEAQTARLDRRLAERFEEIAILTRERLAMEAAAAQTDPVGAGPVEDGASEDRAAEDTAGEDAAGEDGAGEDGAGEHGAGEHGAGGDPPPPPEGPAPRDG